MKLINSLTVGNYNKEIFELSKKLIIYSLIVFIIVLIVILFKLSFICRTRYIMKKINGDFYQVILPYEDYLKWQNETKIYYNDKSYNYNIIEFNDVIVQNTKVYLQLKLEITKFSNFIPILEVSLEDKNISLWDYLSNKFRREVK